MRCETGCIHVHGGEIKHHKDCGFYPDSYSEMLDRALARVEKLKTLPETLQRLDIVTAERNVLREKLKVAENAILAFCGEGLLEGDALMDVMTNALAKIRGEK